MEKAGLPPPLECPICGELMEWRLYKNPKWATHPERYQRFCPTCGQMRPGRITVSKSLSKAKSGKEMCLERIRRRDKRRGHIPYS